MDILDDMGVSKLSANVFLKVNYSFNEYLKFKRTAFVTFLFRNTIHIFTVTFIQFNASSLNKSV